MLLDMACHEERPPRFRLRLSPFSPCSFSIQGIPSSMSDSHSVEVHTQGQGRSSTRADLRSGQIFNHGRSTIRTDPQPGQIYDQGRSSTTAGPHKRLKTLSRCLMQNNQLFMLKLQWTSFFAVLFKIIPLKKVILSLCHQNS